MVRALPRTWCVVFSAEQAADLLLGHLRIGPRVSGKYCAKTKSKHKRYLSVTRTDQEKNNKTIEDTPTFPTINVLNWFCSHFC